MPDETLLQRVQALEFDNARLRRLLEREGSTAGLRHEVRNAVAMVRDVVRQTAEQLEGAEDYLAHLGGRLDAVFRIQNTIANGLADGISLPILVADELQAQALSEGDRLCLEGPDVLLRPAAAGTVALAMHELATNAVKFGALATARGRIAVSWTVGGTDSRLTLRWVESGVAMPAAPGARGFGSEMVENAMRHQLGGEGVIEFAPDGLRCTIRLPMTPRIGGLRGAGQASDDV